MSAESPIRPNPRAPAFVCEGLDKLIEKLERGPIPRCRDVTITDYRRGYLDAMRMNQAWREATVLPALRAIKGWANGWHTPGPIRKKLRAGS